MARTSELLSAGFSKRAISRSLRHGELVRIRNGVYAHPSVSADQRHAIAHGGRLGCVSAAVTLGLWTLPHVGTHIAVPPDFHTFDHPDCSEDVVVHWSGDSAFETHRRVVPLRQAIPEIARCQGLEGALVVLEAALHRSPPLISPSQLVQLAELWPDGGEVIRFAGKQADSGLESLVRWRLMQLGIPSVPQHRIEGVGRVDLLVGDRLIIELDGGTHGDAVGVARDRRRDAVSTALGFRTERYGYQQVVYEWPEVLRAILAIVERGDHLERAAGGRRLNR